MLEVLKRLFAELEEKQIQYVFWKGQNHYQDGLSGNGDIDLLVSKDDHFTFTDILSTCGFILTKTQVYLQNDSIEDWIGLDRTTGKLIHIQLYSEIVFGKKYTNEYSFPFSYLCFDNIVKKDGLNLLNPYLELIILLCRRYVGAIGEKKYKESLEFLRTITDSYSIPNQFPITEAEKRGLVDFCSEPYSYEIKDSLKEMCRKLLKLEAKNAMIKNMFRTILQKIFVRSRSIRLHSKKSLLTDGILIAFLGQDGAGKSTVTYEIEKWLRWKLEVKRFYLGSGDHYVSWRKRIIKLISRIKILKPISFFLSLGDMKYLAKRNYKTLARAVRYKQNGGIALFDRFPQTKYAGINDGPKIRDKMLPKVPFSFLRGYVSSSADVEENYLQKSCDVLPDLVFKLMLTPEESIRRKPEEKIELVRRKHQIIQSLHFDKAQEYVIDATQDYEKELIQIKGLIWDAVVSACSKM